MACCIFKPARLLGKLTGEFVEFDLGGGGVGCCVGEYWSATCWMNVSPLILRTNSQLSIEFESYFASRVIVILRCRQDVSQF